MADTEAVTLFTEELKLCKVGPGETLVVLSAGKVRADYAQAFLVAARSLGATAFNLNLPEPGGEPAGGVYGDTPLAGNRPAIEALKAADMVVDLVGLLFSAEQTEIQAAGTRMLLVMEPMHVLRQMFPTPARRQRVEAAGRLLSAARTLRITSAAGTDLSYPLGDYPVVCQYGYTDEPGRWDNFPGAFLYTQGNDGGVEGKVVLAPGDILSAFKRYVETPVVLTVKGGFITDIAGDGMDATLLRGYIASFNDPRAYAIAHIGWGMDESASWHHMMSTRRLHEEGTCNALAFAGNVLFSTGPNTELGGTNDTACHLDIPLRNSSLHLDGRLIVDAGRLAIPDLLPR